MDLVFVERVYDVEIGQCCKKEENSNLVLENALIIKDGIIIDEEINKYQKRG